MKNKKLLVLLTTTILTNAWGSDSDFDSRGSTPDDSVPLNFGTNDANDYDPNNIFNPSLPQRHRVMRLNDWGDAVDAPHDSDLARAVAASLLDTTHDSNLASAIAASQRPRGRDVIPTELFQRAEAIGIEREVLLAMSAEEANALLAALRSDTTAVEAAPAQAASQHP
ncbi:MAG TPA: hypothetical protein DIC42_03260, partial [Holosporales bacterium]|nr:hypothetical protein [Holosporales bacterium]